MTNPKVSMNQLISIDQRKPLGQIHEVITTSSKVPRTPRKEIGQRQHQAVMGRAVAPRQTSATATIPVAVQFPY